MKKFNRFKVNCGDLGELMGRPAGHKQPSPSNLEDFIKIMGKDKVYVTDKQKLFLQDYVLRVVELDDYPLSTTFKKSLHEHYAYARYGIGKVSNGGKTPVQLDKGEIGEAAAIEFLSKQDGISYVKNEELVENAFFKGRPDILLYENGKVVGVKEIKVPLDFISFLERVDGDHLTADMWQMLAYLDVLGLKQGEICYILVDMPPEIIKTRLNDYKERYILNGYSPEHIKKLLKSIEKSMKCGYIPEHQRIQRFTVTRQGYFTTQMRKRVKFARVAMSNLHEKFEKGLLLREIYPESSEQQSTY